MVTNSYHQNVVDPFKVHTGRAPPPPPVQHACDGDDSDRNGPNGSRCFKWPCARCRDGRLPDASTVTADGARPYIYDATVTSMFGVIDAIVDGYH